jgi:hypothetical protein
LEVLDDLEWLLLAPILILWLLLREPIVRWLDEVDGGARAGEEEEERNKTSDNFLLGNLERRFEDVRVRWPMLEVSDGPTGGGGGGVIWGVESADDNRDASEKGLGVVNNPWVGGDDILNDIDRLWYVMVGDADMDTEEAVVCVDLGLAVMLVLPDEDEE